MGRFLTGDELDELADKADVTDEELAWRGRAEYDAKWRSQGMTVAWIEPVPTWMPACSWKWYALDGKPGHDCIHTICFSLLGGGQIRYQEMNCDPFLGLTALNCGRVSGMAGVCRSRPKRLLGCVSSMVV